MRYTKLRDSITIEHANEVLEEEMTGAGRGDRKACARITLTAVGKVCVEPAPPLGEQRADATRMRSAAGQGGNNDARRWQHRYLQASHLVRQSASRIYLKHVISVIGDLLAGKQLSRPPHATRLALYFSWEITGSLA
ncbi:hypothetical protein J6590_066093 [Homalodisca vitripennis]|nr:hypothetical protein J6590_066093 [Homalodisca vitripennis]